MNMNWLVLTVLFVVLALIPGIAIARGWLRPVGFVPGRPSRREVAIVLLAVIFVAVLFAVADSPFGSAGLGAGLGALFMSIIVALSRRGID